LRKQAEMMSRISRKALFELPHRNHYLRGDTSKTRTTSSTPLTLSGIRWIPTWWQILCPHSMPGASFMPSWAESA
jgi:hypothetical protein